MIYKSFLTVAWLLLCINAYSQNQDYATQHAAQQKRFDVAMKQLYGKSDEFSNKAYYYDKRVHLDDLTGNGLWASIERDGDTYSIQLGVYHKCDQYTTPSWIDGIKIKNGDQVFTVPNIERVLKGNQTRNTYAAINGGSDPSPHNLIYSILKRIVTTGQASVRFETTDGHIDYTLGKREIKELKSIVDAWEALNGL